MTMILNKDTMEKYERRLTPSEVKYGYLRIVKDFIGHCPRPGKSITIINGNDTFRLKMHSSQEGRIDGMTELYKSNRAKAGDVASIVFNSNNEISISFSEGESLFEIETEDKKKTPWSSVIENIREHITCQTYLFCNNETNVRIELIEPILKKLGWNLQNMNREVKCQNSRKRVDFALYNQKNECVLVIEAKSLDQPLETKENGDNEVQINIYMHDDRFKSANYVILTNGQVWQVRDKNGQNIIKSVDILSPEKENENYDSTMYEFFETFNADTFDHSVIIAQEDPPHKTASDRLCHFIITQDGEEIKENTPTETFRKFIEKNIDAIIKLQESNRLKVTVVTQNPNQVRNPKLIKGTNYYSTGDHSTYLKKMLIQQIISESGITATIKNT